MKKKKILILTTSVFTDRMLQYSTFLENLKSEFDIEIWAKSFVSNPRDWEIEGIIVNPIPKLKPLPHYTSYLRRLNEYTWMYKLKANSLLINLKYKVSKNSITKLLLFLSTIFAFLNWHHLLESIVFKVVMLNSRNIEIKDKLKESGIDYLMVLNPFWVEEPVIAIEAIKNQISVINVIPSWDNITTKSRMVYKADYYGVWSSTRIEELYEYYPYSKKKPVFIYGTPQYDVFSNKNFISPKDDFYNKYELNKEKPLLLFTLGSPLFITSEIDVCLEFCKKALQEGLLEKFQILIRPHPIKDFSEYIPKFKTIDSRIKIQSDVQISSSQNFRFMNKEMLINWVSSFYYSDLVVATSSTTLLDAAMFNKPHINITENLSEKRDFDQFLKDVSYGFEHLKKLNNNKLLNNVTSWEMFINQLNLYIENNNLFQNKSEEIVLHLCEFANTGKYGKIFSKELTKILNN